MLQGRDPISIAIKVANIVHIYSTIMNYPASILHAYFSNQTAGDIWPDRTCESKIYIVKIITLFLKRLAHLYCSTYLHTYIHTILDYLSIKPYMYHIDVNS